MQKVTIKTEWTKIGESSKETTYNSYELVKPISDHCDMIKVRCYLPNGWNKICLIHKDRIVSTPLTDEELRKWNDLKIRSGI